MKFVCVSALLLGTRTFWTYDHVHRDFLERERGHQFINLSTGFVKTRDRTGWGKTNVLISALINKCPSPTLSRYCVGTKVSLVWLQLLFCLCFAEKRRKPRKNVKKGIKKCLRMPKGTMKKQYASWEKAWQGYCSRLFCHCTLSGVNTSSFSLWKIIIFLLDVSSVTLGNLPQHQCCEAFKSYMAKKGFWRRKSSYYPSLVFRVPVAEGTVCLMRCRGVWLL